MIKKIAIFTFICLSSIFSQEYYVLEIDETGESTLFIFEDSISSLEENDEIGLFDANGIIDVKALDKGTGKQQNIKIESGSSLSEEEINRMKKEAEVNADEDNKAKETAEKVNAADGMIFQTEKQLKDNEDKIDEDLEVYGNNDKLSDKGSIIETKTIEGYEWKKIK